MKEFIVFPPVNANTTYGMGNDLLPVVFTEADVRDLNDGKSITTMTTTGEEIAVFPQMVI